MKTDISEKHASNLQVKEAESIIRSCVHCGFCNATCPTYQELHDERDGPRGRIYMIKKMLEGGAVSENTRVHLDRCLTCRSCETTCPSGVKYGRLLDITRGLLEREMPRPKIAAFKRWLIGAILPSPVLFSSLLICGRVVRPLLPAALKRKVPLRQPYTPARIEPHKRTMLLLKSCGQSSTTPATNAAATRVLSTLGISLVSVQKAGCCGAVDYHLGAHAKGLRRMRHNIDTWWPEVENGCEAIVVTASGCGPMVQDYGHLLQDDPFYAAKATQISTLAKDLSEVVLAEDLSALNIKAPKEKVALHIPCTLQHGMGLPDTVKTIFQQAGFIMAKTKESHLCCGSAGTYSLLEPALSKRLLVRKVGALTADNPGKIATANIGCQLQIQSGCQTPVHHWIDLLDQAMSDT
ncbi:MAG: glycolate oxidase subunit GlcF [Kordiimonadaceae bacterium]|nr:glycolate oxidase subunit GlcF [Kordiimonadaceae bacterium]